MSDVVPNERTPAVRGRGDRGRYGRLDSSFWRGPRYRDLRQSGPEVLASWVYLLSSPSSNMIGLYQLPLAYAAADLCMPVDKLRPAMDTLAKLGHVHYDHDEELVWVPDFFDTQVVQGKPMKEGDNRAKHVRTILASLPDGHAFVREFCQRYGADGTGPGQFRRVER